MSHRVLLTAAVAAFLGVTAAAACADSQSEAARTVLGRHAGYIGHPEAFVSTYRLDLTAKATPAPGSTPPPASKGQFPAGEVVTFRRGALYHEIDRAEGVGTESGFNGRGYWTSNENRYTVFAFEDAQRRMITSNAIDAGNLDDAAAQERPAQTIDGKPVDVVRVTPPGGIAADLAVDRATGAFVQITYDPEDRYRRFSVGVGGYTEIAPGVRIPTSYRFGRDTVYRLASGIVRAVSDEELRGPSPSPAWAFGAGDPVPVELRYGSYGGRAVVVNVSINGRPGKFLLDSGASQVLLYRPYADRLGLTMLGETAYSGISGGTRNARFARADSIAVGDNVLSNVIVAVSGRDPDDKTPLDGVLGFDLLAGALVHVDLAKQTVVFGDPAALEPAVAKGAYAFSVNLADNTPEIRVKVGNSVTRATIDTGNSDFLTLSDNLKSSGRLVSLVEGTVFFGGVDGITNEPLSCYRLKEILVGPYRYQNASTCLGSERVFGRDGGLIGFDFLRHFNWTFDYRRSRIVLTPNGL